MFFSELVTYFLLYIQAACMVFVYLNNTKCCQKANGVSQLSCWLRRDAFTVGGGGGGVE